MSHRTTSFSRRDFFRDLAVSGCAGIGASSLSLPQNISENQSPEQHLSPEGASSPDDNISVVPADHVLSYSANKPPASFEATDYENTESAIQDAITHASSNGGGRVFLSHTLLPYNAREVSFATGVQMTREGHITDWHDIRAYGARIDGSDDSAAWAGAMNVAIEGETVYHPGGESVSVIEDAPIKVPSGITILGPNGVVQNARVRLGANQNTNLFESESWESENTVDTGIHVRHLDIRGNKSKNTQGHGFAFQAGRCRFLNVRASSFPDDGFHFESSRKEHENRFTECRAAYNGRYGFFIGGRLFDTWYTNISAGNNKVAQMRIETGVTQVSQHHLFAGMVEGSSVTPGRGVEIQNASDIYFGVGIIERTQREAVLINAQTRELRNHHFMQTHFRDCCQETDDQFALLRLKGTNGSTIRDTLLSDCRIDNPQQPNVPQWIVSGNDNGSRRRLTLDGCNVGSVGTGVVDSRFYDQNQVQQSACFYNGNPTEWHTTATIPDGSKKTTCPHGLGVPADVIHTTARGLDTVGITFHDENEIIVERGGSNGSLKVDVYAKHLFAE